MKSSATNTKKKSASKRTSTNKRNSAFPIVAIGASAGGLEAITELLKNLPSTTGMAFIYVQHLSPDHKSMLTEILSHATKMKVQEIDDMDKIKPDNIFIIPHNKGIEVVDGHIKLIPRANNSSAISIDILFSSLANAQKQRVIGIVLSGSGSDGAYGLKHIKHEGGLTIAQDDSAKYTSMPYAAIAAGAVDFILSPKEIAGELVRLSKHPFIKSSGARSGKEDLINDDNPNLKTILHHLSKTERVDFSAYKLNMIKRRIMRRMLLYKLKSLREYTTLLKSNGGETEKLHQDLLIHVTSFFREAETYRYLKTTLLPKLLKRKKKDEPLRIWVPACATGEEAYSIAILLSEIQSGSRNKKQIQIFSTDLSERAVHKARFGVYSKQELQSVSPKRLQRYFTKTSDGYRVNKKLREMCAFATHNILTDPPFSRLDFISCCNLFIYFTAAAQKNVLATFHYALNENGYLMLGKSETISSPPTHFVGISQKHKIFSRKESTGRHSLPALMLRMSEPTPQETKFGNNPITTLAKKKLQDASSTLDSAIDAVLLSEFMPASVVVNRQMEIVQFRGATELYLKHPKGRATFNIIKMALPEIAFELRNAISQVLKTRKRVRKGGIEIKAGNGVKSISVEAILLKSNNDEPLVLIIFSQQQIEIPAGSGKGSKDHSLVRDRRIKKLEEELTIARNEALAASHEQETFIEELQIASEEVVSSNEELQTVNEELQTSKEEIDSANEELITTNQELKARNDQLNESHEYSQAITDTIYEPMVVLDKFLRVSSANRAFYNAFKLLEEETEGELFFDLGGKQWSIPRLRELLEDILSNNSHFNDFGITHNFPGIGEKVMLLNARRVFHKSKNEQLILLAIQDVTEERNKKLELQSKENEEAALKAKLEAFENAQANMKDIFLRAPAMICIHRGPAHVYEMMNDSYKQLIGYREVIGKPIRAAFPEISASGICEILDDVYRTGKPFMANEMAVQFYRNEVLESAIVDFVAQPSYDITGKIDGIIVYASEVTKQVALREKIAKSEARYSELIMGLPVAVYTCNAEGYVELYNQKAVELWGAAPQVGNSLWSDSWKTYRTDGSPLPFEDCPISMTLKEKRSVSFEYIVERPDGTRRSIIPNPQLIFDADGKVTGAVNTLIDITPQVENRKNIEANEARLKVVVEASELGTWELNLKTNEPTYSQRYLEIIGGYKENVKLSHSQLIQHLHPDDLPIREKAFKEAFDTGFLHYEARLIWIDKSVHWMEGRGKVFYDEENKPLKLIGTVRDTTPEKNHEQELKESEKQFAILANNIQNLAWMANAEGWIYWYNDRWYEYTGTTHTEMEGWGWKSVHDPEKLPDVLEKWQHSLKTGKPFEMVFPLKGKDQIFRPFLTLVFPLRDNEGKIIRWIGTNTDISAQKEAEEQFRQMAEYMPQKVWTADAEGNKNYFNQVMLDYTGLPFEELKDWGWEKIIHPDNKEEYLRLWRESVRTGNDFVVENQFRRKDGKFLWHLTRAIALKDDAGKIKMWIGSKTEIQDQIEFSEKLEESLKRSNDRMRTILHHAPDAVISIDEEGIIRSWNPEAENIFGWTEREIIGRTLAETIIPERHHKGLETGIKHFLRTGEGPSINKPMELSAIRKAGDEFPVEVKISTSKIDNQYIFIGFVRDISVRKEAEEMIQNKTNQLIEAQKLAHIGSWEWDVLSNKFEWSDEFTGYMGYLRRNSA